MVEKITFWFESEAYQDDYKTAITEAPQYLCKNCGAIIGCSFSLAESDKDLLVCPTCSEGRGFFTVEFEEVVAHSQSLIQIVSNPTDPLFGALLKALSQAQAFLHFSTFGISYEVIGIIKLLSHKLSVRGIISNLESDKIEELEEYMDENPNLELICTKRDDSWNPSPHQKLIVIDGLLTFKGSANLTLGAWRKAQEGLDTVDVMTNVKRIRDYHNQYFAKSGKAKIIATGIELV